MYEVILNKLKETFLPSKETFNEGSTIGKKNILLDGTTRLVSSGNINFEGIYTNAEIMEKKKILIKW